MSETNWKALWNRRTAIAALVLGVALLVMIPATRQAALRLAERTGLWQEEKHDLVPVRDAKGDIKYWTCTMHPSVRAAAPGKCPICGMDLVAVRNQIEPEPAAVTEHSAGVFSLSTQRQQLIGVQFTEVAQQDLLKTIRAVGRVELDEQRIAEVHPKISGWIEEVFVNYQFQHVQKGDPLFTIYSPQLLAAQDEYLLALKAQEKLAAEGALPSAIEGARVLVNDARTRLRLWDISEEQIRLLHETRKPSRTLTVYSPISGHVMERSAYPQKMVTPDTAVYRIADHSRVWVHVDIYENDIGVIRRGQTAVMTVPAYPGRSFSGRVTFLWPHLDPGTRTMKARLEFANPDLALKPEMYADVTLRIPLGRHLVVPKSAVLPTGERFLVFLDRGEGRMEIRAVELGVDSEEWYSIRKGLRAGERVVTAANFLVDAESQVQGALQSWQARPAHAH